MPTVKFVNALDSFAGGLAGGLQSAQETKRQAALDVERQRRAAIEEADNARRLTMAEQDQAMQMESQRRAKEAADATQQAFATANAPREPQFKSRVDALGSVLPKVDPRFTKEIVNFANQRDLADHTVAQIQTDVANGLYDDVQAGPDGKEQRIPNPQRQTEVQGILADLQNGAAPEAALTRLANLRAPIIGQRSQMENSLRAVEGVRKRLENAWTQGIDISEATHLFHVMQNEVDPQEWLRDPVNKMSLESALRGYAVVTNDKGKPMEIHPADRDEHVRMVWEKEQAEQRLAALTEEFARYKAERERENIENDKKRADATMTSAEAALRRAGKSPTVKPTFNPSSYAEFRKLYKAENPNESDETKIDAGARALMEKARTASNKANEDVGAIGRLPGAVPGPLEGLTADELDQIRNASTEEEAAALARKFKGVK